MIIKVIFKILFRIIQIAAIAFFGYWVYMKFTSPGLNFAFFTITAIPIITIGLIIGSLISTIFLIKGSIFKFVRTYNAIMFLIYLGSIAYLVKFII